LNYQHFVIIWNRQANVTSETQEPDKEVKTKTKRSKEARNQGD
jgi:hypothetical protein